MTWQTTPIDPKVLTGEYLYDLSKRYRLVPHRLSDPVGHYSGMAEGAVGLKVHNGSDETVAHVLIFDIVDGESAQLQFIPTPKYFAPGELYHKDIKDAMSPVLEKLIEMRGLRRVTAAVPETRCRTSKALRACGFKKEGLMRQALRFRNKPPEDMVVMGYLPERK